MQSVRPVLYVLGLLLSGLGVSMAVPALLDVSHNNPDWAVFVASGAATIFVGLQLVFTTRSAGRVQINLRQAFLLTTAAWTLVAAFAALPFLFFGGGLTYADAFFEAISGLTTTGSTVLVGLDEMPPGILMWRSLLQWIGGVGIVVTAILILPLLRVGGMQLFRTESSDRAEKIVPRAVELVRYIVVIYVVLSVACALTYWSLGMSAFDAVCHAMTTLSTGGFSTHDASFAYFENPYIEWAAVVFMTSGALPFVAYIATVRGGGQPLWRDTQARTFVLSMIVVSLVLALVIAEHLGLPFIEAIRLAAFNSVSIATTTGYASADYVEWGGFAVMVFMLLTLMGGCTGSTAGAIKMFRHQIMFIAARTHVANLLSPNLVSVPTYQGRPVTDDVLRSVLVFVVVYFGVLVVLSLGVASYGYDLVTSLSAAATAMGNVGPGLGPIIGPAGNFADLPDGAKWLLSAGMLMGRLEFFTVLVLFDRQFWHW